MSGDKNPGTRLIAGAMSGTSADGIDVAIVAISGRGLEMSVKLLHHENLPYDADLRKRIFSIRSQGSADLGSLAKLGRDVSLAYANAVNTALSRSNLKAKDLACIAAHGQTLYHAPPNTIQWLDPALVAAKVGCPVVSDFRRADCAAGGQGAPLVPFADYILFRSREKDRAVVNIGGIANITCLFRGSGIDETLAWDTGPGNCVSDYIMRKNDPTGPGVDLDGAIASQGDVVAEIVEAFQKDPYFAKPAPKSTDGPTMIRIYEQSLAAVGGAVPIPDQLATACWLAASEIGRALKVFGDQFWGELIVSGGGTKNQTLMEMLTDSLGHGWQKTDQFEIPSDAKEAVAFALLAAATLDGIPSNIPSVTGAKRGVVLGSITPKP